MKRIAIPVVNSKLAAHFGHAPHFYIYDTENKGIVKESMELPPDHSVGSIPNWLAELKIDAIISGGMGEKAVEIFNANKIDVFLGAPVETPEKLIADFLNGTLQVTGHVCDEHQNHGNGEHDCH